jgi:hypothetical protein
VITAAAGCGTRNAVDVVDVRGLGVGVEDAAGDGQPGRRRAACRTTGCSWTGCGTARQRRAYRRPRDAAALVADRDHLPAGQVGARAAELVVFGAQPCGDAVVAGVVWAGAPCATSRRLVERPPLLWRPLPRQLSVRALAVEGVERPRFVQFIVGAVAEQPDGRSTRDKPHGRGSTSLEHPSPRSLTPQGIPAIVCS